MKVTQIVLGRFHHFHLARQMERKGLLETIWTGYPRFALKDEQGIPQEKIKTFPWMQGTFMASTKIGLHKWGWYTKHWSWHAQETLDKHVASKIDHPGVLIALSGSGLRAGIKIQQLGGKYICDRGSTHLRFQRDILVEEYKRWGFTFDDVDERMLVKEEAEYQQADRVTIPSEFSRNSFIQMGVSPDKIIKIPYGARLDRFKKEGDPDKEKFSILWVGGVNLRKGFMYALHAFQKFTHPKKEFNVIGAVSSEIAQLIKHENLDKINFLGTVPNYELSKYYSRSHVFILPSIEDGFGMVMGEALACGCPVIATTNTGARDLLPEQKEGLIIEIRSPQAILDGFRKLADDPLLRIKMSEAGMQKVKDVQGWDQYGDAFEQTVLSLSR